MRYTRFITIFIPTYLVTWLKVISELLKAPYNLIANLIKFAIRLLLNKICRVILHRNQVVVF